jgi:hypothetical protein
MPHHTVEELGITYTSLAVAGDGSSLNTGHRHGDESKKAHCQRVAVSEVSKSLLSSRRMLVLVSPKVLAW